MSHLKKKIVGLYNLHMPLPSRTFGGNIKHNNYIFE